MTEAVQPEEEECLVADVSEHLVGFHLLGRREL